MSVRIFNFLLPLVMNKDVHYACMHTSAFDVTPTYDGRCLLESGVKLLSSLSPHGREVPQMPRVIGLPLSITE